MFEPPFMARCRMALQVRQAFEAWTRRKQLNFLALQPHRQPVAGHSLKGSATCNGGVA
jgi:hypothetical protein